MKVANKDFWEDEAVIVTQDQEVPKSADYEEYLYQKAKALLSSISNTKACIFGCGTGREIPEIMKHVGISEVVASDISENMIKKCNENLKLWNLPNTIDTLVGDAAQFSFSDNAFELVTVMNNMMNYVIDKKERYKIFSKSYDVLKPKGCIIGVVHNQVGTPQKTGFFFLRKLAKPFLKHEVGYRLTGFKGLKFGGYYFTKNDLKKHLSDNGFINIEIISLSEFYKNKGVKYDLLKGYNNLLFFATKP